MPANVQYENCQSSRKVHVARPSVHQHSFDCEHSKTLLNCYTPYKMLHQGDLDAAFVSNS